MYVDNRVLLPFVGPFVVLGMARLAFFLAGAEWSEPEMAAVFSLIFGASLGVFVANVAYETETSLGGFWIGRKREGGE